MTINNLTFYKTYTNTIKYILNLLSQSTKSPDKHGEGQVVSLKDTRSATCSASPGQSYGDALGKDHTYRHTAFVQSVAEHADQLRPSRQQQQAGAFKATVQTDKVSRFRLSVGDTENDFVSHPSGSCRGSGIGYLK